MDFLCCVVECITYQHEDNCFHTSRMFSPLDCFASAHDDRVNTRNYRLMILSLFTTKWLFFASFFSPEKKERKVPPSSFLLHPSNSR